MRSKVRTFQPHVLILLSFILFIHADAATTECDGVSNECQCSPDFQLHNASPDGTKTICSKMSSPSKLSYDEAEQDCKKAYSYLTSKIAGESVIKEDLIKTGVKFLWMGIRRVSGFYVIRSEKPKLFQETSEWGQRWNVDEPIHDCVALNVDRGRLVTLNCSTRLEYICENKGLPIYPVGSLLCPEGYLFSYRFRNVEKMCLKALLPKPFTQAYQTCLEEGGDLFGDDDYNALSYDSMGNLYRTVDSVTAETSLYDYCMGMSSGSTIKCSCVNKSNLSAKRFVTVNCTEKLPFVCKHGFQNHSVSSWITPQISQSLPRLTCNVGIEGKNISHNEISVLYQWYKDEIPVPDQHTFDFYSGFYADPFKNNSLPVIRQGTYRCEVRLLGSLNTSSVAETDFFYSDVSTYIFTIHKIQQGKYKDFSRLQRLGFMRELQKKMLNFKESVETSFSNELWAFHNMEWGFQNMSLQGSYAKIQVLLYINWTKSVSGIRPENEKEVYIKLEKYVKEYDGFRDWGDTFFTLNSADVCFGETVHEAKLLEDEVLLWYDTFQTKNAVSNPWCLNGWTLKTRECKASFVLGGQWASFDYSSCSRYQKAIEDFDVLCPKGFKKLKQNICYQVHYQKKTWNEANKICAESSSYLMDNKTMTEDDFSTAYWLSLKYSYGKFQWVGMTPGLPRFSLESIQNERLGHDCAYIIENQKIRFENCSEKLAFVCIHQPQKVLSSVIFSKTWSKLSSQEASYYISSNKKNWTEARETCQNTLVESTLLHSIQDKNIYLPFKLFMYMQPLMAKASSWWMNLKRNGDEYEWLGFSSSPVQFVDWSPQTNFIPEKSAGLLTLDVDPYNRIHWNLDVPSAKHEYICEMPSSEDSRPTHAYIEIRTGENYTEHFKNLHLHCVPSGWYVSTSIVWFKDGIVLDSGSDPSQLSVPIASTVNIKEAISSQGYYWCSVSREKPLERIFSSKILYRIPGFHTYVLIIQSGHQEYFREFRVSDFSLPQDFMESLHKSLPYNNTFAVLRNITYNNLHVDIFLHILCPETTGDEDNVILDVMYSIKSSNELFKRINSSKNHILVRSTVACYAEKTSHYKRNLSWRTTPVGQTALPQEICITAEGKSVQRKCLGDFNVGAFWDEVIGECIETPSEITANLFKLSCVTITNANALATSNQMAKLTASIHKLKPIDVQYVAQILVNVANQFEIDPEVYRSVIKTTSNVIDARQLFIERSSPPSNSSGMISEAIESIAENIALSNETFATSTKNFAVAVAPLNLSTDQISVGAILQDWNMNLTTFFHGTKKTFSDSSNDFEAGIMLPTDLVLQKVNEGIDRVVFMIHQNYHYVENLRVISSVIHSSIGVIPIYDITPPVEMIFRIPEHSSKDVASVKCVFWDQRLNNDYGGWSYKGCFSRLLNDNNTLHCLCDHLTSFAVILELKPGDEIIKVHKTTLSIITYVGCSLSIFGLGMIILTFLVFRKWRNDTKHKVLCNLAIALICFLLIFLLGIENTSSKVQCLAVAVLLHYFMLASFAWMLVEAVMQYLSLVKVIGTYIPCFIQKAMAFAWGMPLFIVITVSSVNYKLYSSRKNYCWLADEVFYYAVAVPVLVMLATNFLIFALILYTNTCGRSKKYLRNNQNERKEAVTRAKAIFCVSLLLGLSWIFGFLAVDGAKLIFQYLFAVTTTLQGFFIFIFFVFRQKSTRDLWKNLVLNPGMREKTSISHISGTTNLPSRTNNNDSRPTTQHRLSKIIFKTDSPYLSFIE